MKTATDADLAASLLEALPDAALVLDREGRVVLANRAVETVLGRRRRAIGRPAAALANGLDGIAEAIERAITGAAVEWRVARANGPDRPGEPLDLLARPLRDRKGTLQGGLVLLRRIEPSAGQAKEIEAAGLDPITGLPGPRHVHEQLAAGLEGGGRVGLLCVDLGGFRRARDLVGHAASDALSAELARRIRAVVGEGDVVGQLGGDEIAVIQRDIGGFGASVGLARRIIARLREAFEIDGRLVHGWSHIGISLHPEDGCDAEQLVRNAHLALERARADGPNSFQFFLPEMGERLQLRQELERDLGLALERGELQLHYQPQVELASGRVVALEALLRWQHPERGPVPPGAFIPIAEESGLILPIGQWVLREACRQLRRFDALGLPAVRVAVNLSPAQFSYPELVIDVTGVLEETGLAPERLVLEITEGMLMRDVETAGRALSRLRELGVGIAVDDFGTGHSCLAYLKHFPLQRLKIDRCFVAEIGENGADAVIVQAIVALGHGLGLTVVAEGVETPAQLECLRRLGCDEIQGFYLARPTPAAACAKPLAAGFAARLREAAVALQRFGGPRPPARGLERASDGLAAQAQGKGA